MKVSTLTIEMAANVARLTKDMDQARRTVDKAMGDIRRVAGYAAAALGAIGVAVSLGALANIVRETGRVAREIENLSQVANASKQVLQGWSYGAQTVGVGQEKLADILKDVNDKVGEFLQTGGGPMKDFFEQIAPRVGVTADQFRRLSGPEALQLYVSSLQKAGVSQKEATFYMEALASDATALLPLLKDNGAEMNRLAGEAEAMGLVMSDEAIVQAQELARQTDMLTAKLTGMRNTIAAQVLPVLVQITKEFTSARTGGISLAEAFGKGLATSLQIVAATGLGVAYVFETIGDTIGASMAMAERFLKLDFEGGWQIRRDYLANVEARNASYAARIQGIFNPEAPTQRAALDFGGDGPGVGGLGGGKQSSAEKAAARAAAAELKAQQALYAGLLGVSADYVEQLQRIQTMRESGMVTEAQSIQLLEQLIAKQPIAGEQMKAMAQWAEESAAANHAAYEEQLRRVDGVKDELKAQELANEAMGLTGVALAELEAARTRDAAAELERRAVILEGVDPAIARLYRDQAKALQDLAKARLAGADKQAVLDANKATLDEWNKTADQISQSLTDALMRGFENGKGFGQNLGDSIVNMFKTWVARAIADAIKRAILAAMAQTQWGRLINGATGGGGGGMNLGGNATRLMGMGASNWIGNTIGGGNIGALTGGAAGTMSWANVAGSMYANATGTGISGLLATNGAYGTAVGSAASTGAAAGAAAGVQSGLAAVPVWGWIALAVMALWEPMFGRKLKEVGRAGNFDGAGGIATAEYSHRTGGWFRGDKTNYNPLNDGGAFERQLRGIQDGMVETARVMGLGEDAIRNFAGSVNINLKGLDAEEAAKKTREELVKLQAQMLASASFAPAVTQSFEQVEAAALEMGMGLEDAARHAREVTARDDALKRQGFEQMTQYYIGLINQTDEAMAQAGITSAALADVITAGMTGRLDESQVGAQLADIVLGGIYNTIAGGFAAQISDVFMQQIIQPIMMAVTAGVPLTSAISQQAMQTVVATAQNAAAQLTAIFSDPVFRQTMAQLQTVISGIAGASVKPARSIKAFGSAALAAGEAARAAAEEAKRAAEELRRRWRGVADSIIDEINRIKGEILGDSQQGLAFAQSQFAIATAAARAGDIEAAQRLPQLSQSLLRVADQVSTSQGDLRALQGWTMRSLAETNALIQGWAGNAPMQQAASQPAPQAPATQANAAAIAAAQQSNDALLAEVKQLRALTLSSVAAQQMLESKFSKVTNGGNVMRTQAVAA